MTDQSDLRTTACLKPLRIPAGWSICWNTLFESSDVNMGDFGGSSLFSATHASRRFAIDVAFRPEFDPTGSFHLSVMYQPWDRSENGKRRADLPLKFDGRAEDVHAFETRSFRDLIDQLEHWLARCATWTREGN